jgi:hypothetical protein
MSFEILFERENSNSVWVVEVMSSKKPALISCPRFPSRIAPFGELILMIPSL